MMKTCVMRANGMLWAMCLALGGLLMSNGALAQSESSPPSAQTLAWGQRLYREGLGVSGQPLAARGAAQTALGAADVACASCHRRSGYGGSEGQFAIRPITAAALFVQQEVTVHSPRVKAQLGARLRPAYTPALLARALRTGVDSSGKPLDPLMPHYVLSNDDVSALAAYLGTLSAQSSPGVDEQEIHFATVIQPGVEPVRRDAMVSVMQAFFRDKGANVRQDEQRRDAGTMRMYRAYRKWVLHVWELTGPSSTWDAQLEGFYRQQPVFALLTGLGGASWRPIHEFCERLEIPSVLPQVELPLLAGSNAYNLYGSRGLTLEAEVLAKFMRDGAPSGTVVQVYRRDDAGLTAAAAFTQALGSAATLQDLPLEGLADEAFWSRVAAAKPAAVVLWLGAKDLPASGALAALASRPVYLSFDLVGAKFATASSLGTNVRMVYPSDLAPKHEARMLRSKIWLRNKGIAVTDEAVQINTLFALAVASDALGHMMDSFSRDYFVERIEHMVAQISTPSYYQSLSLGPGQRYAAKGSAVVQLGSGGTSTWLPLSGWIVP